MSRAQEVLARMSEIKRTKITKKVRKSPLRIKDSKGVRRRQAAKLSLEDLLAGTKKLRSDFNDHHKIELNSAILHKTTQQLVVKAQVRALTDKTRTAYPLTLQFFRVTSEPAPTKTHKIPVDLGSGEKVYIQRLSAKDNPVSVRCNCADFQYTWNWYDADNKALTGPRVKPYVRKTPPPPGGYPYRNPIKTPGLCKHLNGLIQKLISLGIVGR